MSTTHSISSSDVPLCDDDACGTCARCKREAERAQLLLKINLALCFECQAADGRALRRLDGHNRELLICQECAIVCYQCDHDAGEDDDFEGRCELVNCTSIANNAHEAEEVLCRQHWEENADRDIFGEDEDSLQSDDERPDPAGDQHFGYGSSSARTASNPLRFDWNDSRRRPYPLIADRPSVMLELEPWEWRTEGEEHAEELKKLCDRDQSTSGSILAVHESPCSHAPSAKRQAIE